MKRVELVAPSLRAAKTSDLEVVRNLLRAAQLPTEGLADQFGDQYVVAESGIGPLISSQKTKGTYPTEMTAWVMHPGWDAVRCRIRALLRDRFGCPVRGVLGAVGAAQSGQH
jgi:hypothetical protein